MTTRCVSPTLADTSVVFVTTPPPHACAGRESAKAPRNPTPIPKATKFPSCMRPSVARRSRRARLEALPARFTASGELEDPLRQREPAGVDGGGEAQIELAEVLRALCARLELADP